MLTVTVQIYTILCIVLVWQTGLVYQICICAVSDESCLFLYRNEQGNTPLHLACMRKGNIGIVKELIASDVKEVNRLLNEKYV